MKTTKLALTVMLATGLAAAPFAAQAKSHKAKQGSSMSSSLIPPVKVVLAPAPTKAAP
jgi:hypothetical protein